ncbi:MAG: DUF4345 family protein [Pseudomonadota bacterium]|nr:DUF4345 family protein [Pseudomonadota bacterium]
MGRYIDFGRGVLLVTGLIFGLYGLYCVFDPALAAGLSGLETPSTSAVIELQAMYGGFQAAFGILLLVCCVFPGMVRYGLWTAVAMAGGLALARGVGISMHGLGGAYIVLAFIYEAGTAIAGLAALMSGAASATHSRPATV